MTALLIAGGLVVLATIAGLLVFAPTVERWTMVNAGALHISARRRNDRREPKYHEEGGGWVVLTALVLAFWLVVETIDFVRDNAWLVACTIGGGLSLGLSWWGLRNARFQPQFLLIAPAVPGAFAVYRFGRWAYRGFQAWYDALTPEQQTTFAEQVAAPDLYPGRMAGF